MTSDMASGKGGRRSGAGRRSKFFTPYVDYTYSGTERRSNTERRSGIERRVCLNRRSAGDRRFGTNPKGYDGPEQRAVFDRRNHKDRRQEIA